MMISPLSKAGQLLGSVGFTDEIDGVAQSGSSQSKSPSPSLSNPSLQISKQTGSVKDAVEETKQVVALLRTRME